MDAAQTNFKKIALFFLAVALLSMAPLTAYAQPTLVVSQTTVTIGNASCNESQTIQVSSSDGSNVPFTIAVGYNNSGDPNGQWLYASILNTGTTSSGSTVSGSTGTTGTTVTVGLARTIGVTNDSGFVTITDTATGAQTTVQVFYQASNSCGGNTGSASNGDITVTPGTVSLNASSQTTQVLAIQNLTGNNLTFNVSTNSTGGNWLTASSTTSILSPNGNASVTVTGNASNATSGGTLNGQVQIQSYSGTQAIGSAVVIPVTFVTSGSGTGTGTGSSGTLTVGNAANSNVDNISFTYVYPNLPSAQCIPLQDTATPNNAYAYTVSTASGGSWLQVNFGNAGPIIGSIAPGSNACITLSVSNAAGTLNSGAYSGTVSITSSSGSTATINANLYVSAGLAPGISVSPGPVFSFQNVAANSSVVQQQSFTISAGSGVGLGVAAPVSPPSWFTMSTPQANNNSETFTVTANASGLAAGVYTTVITMQSTGNGSSVNGGQTYITVVLPVGQPGATCTSCGTGTTTTSAVAPLTLNFEQQVGNSFWTSAKEAQTVTITGPQGSTWSAAIIYGGTATNWLNIDSPTSQTGTFGSNPSSLVVDLFNGVGSLSAGNYNATIQITTPSGVYDVTVNLLVTPSNQPVLLGLPPSATFFSNNGSTPAQQAITVVGSDNTSPTQNQPGPTITAGTPTQTWITATTSGNTLTINTTPGSLATGLYYGTVPVSSTAYQNPIQYPVVLVVNGGTGTGSTGPLTLTATSIPFTNVTGTVSTTLGVTATSATNFSVTAQETSCTSSNWLSVGTGSYTASTVNTPISISVTPTGISTGTTCSGTITLQTSTGTQTVSVTMSVGTASGSGNVTLNTTTLNFSYTQNQSQPAQQDITVLNANSGTASVPFTATVAEQSCTSSAWLSTNVTSASTPYNNPGLIVTATPGSLPPGTCAGTITISPTGGTAQVVNVSLTITGSAVVTATPTTVSLTYQAGGTPPTGTIQVSGGGSAAGFTATAASNTSWLQVSPTSGTTPNSGTLPLTVSVVPSALSTLLPSSTPYTGTVTIAGTSPATGTTVVQVSLTVSAPLPVITGVTNAASGASGAVSPGEIISIYGSNMGPSTAVQLNSTTCPSPCSSVPTTMGGVTVKFLPSGLVAPILYAGSGQVNAVVPYGVAGLAQLSVEVVFLGQSSNAFGLTLAPTAPGLFTQAFGTGPAAANQYSPSGVFQGENTPSNPVSRGGILVLYLTGEGVVTPTPVSGTVIQATSGSQPTPVPGYAPTVLIGGNPATVLYYGETAGLVAGVLQINVLVPQSVNPGTPLISVTIGPNSSQAGVTVAVQ